MNDFTKEELEDMINWGEIYTEFGNSWCDKIHRPLINKIQSVIDNYCDHLWAYCFSSDGSSVKCQKCDRQLK